jgi:hypothetical protein
MAGKSEKDATKQVEAFRKAARDLGCDDDEGRFKDALRRVGKAKPAAAPDKPKRG